MKLKYPFCSSVSVKPLQASMQSYQSVFKVWHIRQNVPG